MFWHAPALLNHNILDEFRIHDLRQIFIDQSNFLFHGERGHPWKIVDKFVQIFVVRCLFESQSQWLKIVTPETWVRARSCHMISRQNLTKLLSSTTAMSQSKQERVMMLKVIRKPRLTINHCVLALAYHKHPIWLPTMNDRNRKSSRHHVTSGLHRLIASRFWGRCIS